MYYETTQEIEVSVEPFYLEEQSDPDEGRFVFAYHVRIQNQSVRTVQLINRFWKITDGFGRIQEVRGPGVVGEQPVLEPGEMFEYTSGCPLTTPTGIMAGTYEMETTNGDRFNVKIPAFSLYSPNVRTHIN